MQPSEQITRLLRSWDQGDQAALDALVPLVYGELHRLAHRYMARERPDRTLQTTAQVNEAHVRLCGFRARQLGEPIPFLRRLRASNEAHPGGLGTYL
jgi:hypothetical protein